MRVTFADAYNDIVRRSDDAKNWVEWWRKKFAAIVPTVESFVHEKLFDVSSNDVHKTLERGTHALGNIEKSSELREVEDVQMPATAIQDLFHRFLEYNGTLPTWNEFSEFLHERSQYELLLGPWWRQLRPALAARGFKKSHEQRIAEAIQWRLGRMYYSNLREIDMLARMRERHDIHLKYHIFADVRLRTDFWLDDFNISVFLSNSRYRGSGASRKNKAAKFLADAKPPFYFAEIEFPNQWDFGKLYRVADDDLDHLAGRLRRRE